MRLLFILYIILSFPLNLHTSLITNPPVHYPNACPHLQQQHPPQTVAHRGRTFVSALRHLPERRRRIAQRFSGDTPPPTHTNPKHFCWSHAQRSATATATGATTGTGIADSIDESIFDRSPSTAHGNPYWVRAQRTLAFRLKNPQSWMNEYKTTENTNKVPPSNKSLVKIRTSNKTDNSILFPLIYSYTNQNTRSEKLNPKINPTSTYLSANKYGQNIYIKTTPCEYAFVGNQPRSLEEENIIRSGRWIWWSIKRTYPAR